MTKALTCSTRSKLAAITWLHCLPSPSSYPILFSELTISSPWKVAPGTHPLPIVDLRAPSKHRVICASSSGVEALPSSIHCHGVCVTTKPRPRIATCHLEAHSEEWRSGCARRLAVRWCTHEVGKLSAAVETESRQTITRNETSDGTPSACR